MIFDKMKKEQMLFKNWLVTNSSLSDWLCERLQLLLLPAVTSSLSQLGLSLTTLSIKKVNDLVLSEHQKGKWPGLGQGCATGLVPADIGQEETWKSANAVAMLKP